MFLFLRLLIVACLRFESIRRECIEHLIVLSERHLIKILSEYFEYYNRSRPTSDDNGIVECTDFQALLDHWGPCP